MKPISILLAWLIVLLAQPARGAVSQAPGQVWVYLPVVPKTYTDPVIYRTGIADIGAFLDSCPQSDPAYSQITADFTLRLDGQVVPYNNIQCSEPVSSMPIDGYTNFLITLQALRVSYYMDTGQPNQLPWSDKSLYQWMKTYVSGVNLKTVPGQLYCCDVIGGKNHISQSMQEEYIRDSKRSWEGLSSTISYFAHEIRHADGGHFHVTGCPAFPNPSDPSGCDPTYDLNDLGAYGIQYWLHEAWLLGKFNVGQSCSADGGLSAANTHMYAANIARERFVINPPPLLALPAQPYGGPCYAP